MSFKSISIHLKFLFIPLFIYAFTLTEDFNKLTNLALNL